MIVFQGNLSKNFTQAEYHPGSATVYMTKETVVFINILQSFRRWLNKKMYVVSWYRTPEENKAVGGITASNHLAPRGCALDWHLYNEDITKEMFIKYAKKWASCCQQYGCIGEAGLYKWGMHIGVQNEKQARANGDKFYHWDSRSGKQINMPFPELYDIK